MVWTELKEKKAAHPGAAQQVSLCPGQAPTCDSKWERCPELEREWEGKGGDREMERDGDTQWGGGGDQGQHVLQTSAGSDLPRPLGTPAAVRRKRSVSPMGHVPQGPSGGDQNLTLESPGPLGVLGLSPPRPPCFMIKGG